jgi:predicted GIY-YIG superfamily endonuclease
MATADLPESAMTGRAASAPDTCAAAWLAIPTPEELARDADPEPVGPSGRSVVYTLHFDPPYSPSPDAPPYKTAGHYTGWAANLERRLAEHEAGRGARLTQVQVEAGGTWRLAAVEPGTRFRERQLKGHSATRRCPICKTEAQAEAETEAEPELEAGI